MTTHERESRLTAYALNDPSLGEADRLEVEAALRTDPAARQAVDETLKLAHLLATGLAAEQAREEAEQAAAVPLTLARRSRFGRWQALAALAAVLLVAVGGFYAIDQLNRQDGANGIALKITEGTPDDQGLGDSIPADPNATKGTVAPKPPPVNLPAGEGATSYEQSLRGDVGQSDGLKNPTRESTTRSIPPTGPSPQQSAAAQPGFGAGAGLGGAPGGMPRGGGGLGGFGGGVPGPGLPPGAGINGGIGGFGGGIGGVPGSKPAQPGATGPVAELEKRFGRPATDNPHAPLGPPSPKRDRFATGDDLADAIRQPDGRTPPGHDRYSSLIENSFITVQGEAALSTFGVDVDTASYSIVRKYLGMNQLPPPDSVRLEEMVNYFRYQDKAPEGDDPFAVTVEVAECPWQPKHRLARIGLKAKPIDSDKRPPSNLVFLIDVSGSMAPENRLPLVKQSLRMLVNQLGENDRVAMVVYAGAAGLVLDSTSALKKDVILGAIDRLQSGGSTNGAGGLQQAYDVAVANFIKNGTNRVILCTDGDWNVGTTSTDALVKLIEEKRKTNVFLSVFGFGMGNLRDEMMVKLAGKGNGNYGYIDSLKEANKALVEQMGGTLVTVAKDVKIQVEFNPATVQAYRLLGYEKRALAAKDFADDKKDAGEMGAGHVVTALYELVPAGLPTPAAKGTEELRYQKPDPAPKPAVKAGVAKEAFVVKMRHKKPDGDTSTLRELPVTDLGKGYAEASEDFRFSAAVASFAMLLRDSPYRGESSFALVHELADSARKYDPSNYRAEFMEMIRLAKKLGGKE